MNTSSKFLIIQEKNYLIIELYKSFTDNIGTITWSKMNIDNHRLTKQDLVELRDTLSTYLINSDKKGEI